MAYLSVRRYEPEFLYVVHANVTGENYRRIESLFSKAYPDFYKKMLEPTDEDQRTYYAIYRDRLLEEASLGGGAEADAPEKKFAIVQKQVVRELRVGARLKYFFAEARKGGSVKAVFDRLVAKDDPERPVCATEPNKGLFVYRRLTATSRVLEDLKDSGVRFGVDFSGRVTQVAGGDLPAFPKTAWVLGEGRGRQIFQLLKVHRDAEPEEK